MRATNMKKAISKTQLLLATMVAVARLFTPVAFAASPGVTGPTFNLTARAAFISQPDGQNVYSWGYGCNGAPAGFAPAAITNGVCHTMQVPGPTLIVTEGQTVGLTDQQPAPCGRQHVDSFPRLQRDLIGQRGTEAGLLTQEATPANTVTYTFMASTPGTRAYYSGTQGDLQIEMGLYGAIIVLPATIPANCTGGIHASNSTAQAHWFESDFRLAAAAYNHDGACYDREYLFQFSEMDPRIHREAEEQVTAKAGCTVELPVHLNVATEPYVPAYFMINGRSMPDLMDPNYATEYPHQPYNGNPHMHPGELVLLRVIGPGRWQHPFHEHGNHVRVLARDGNLILSATDANSLAGPLLFTTTTTPGHAWTESTTGPAKA